MKIIVVFTFLLFSLAIRAQNDEDNDVSIIDANFGAESYEEISSIECGELEQYSRCNANPACQRTCETLGDDLIPCPRQKSCIEGCICREGYVRSELHGSCIYNNRCPRVRH